MLETFLGLFLFSQKAKNISEHQNPLKNKFEHLFEAKFGRHQSLKNTWPLEGQWALAVSRVAHLGFGRTIGSAGPLPMASGPILLQQSLAVEACLLQRCPALLSLNRGRGVSFELSHSTLIHSLPLKLSQTLLSGFHWIFARIWFQETSLSHFFAARKEDYNSRVWTFISISLT